MVGPEIPISENQIDERVVTFIARARVDPKPGPVFITAIGESQAAWQVHEAKIASFWHNAVGLDRSFSGNPMLKHLANKDIVPDQFGIWLPLFQKTARETLAPEAANSIAALADRIGRSLQMGLVQFRQNDGLPPRFT